ncbi:hypothetical protein HY990_04770 [Candidatus Micrarchaeota archaeon]|nr:hypothetical protein [Candidatus Micrarchaeota archaeon]
MTKSSFKFEPQNGKMTVLDGKSAYINGDYTALFVQMPMNYNAGTMYYRLQTISVLKSNKKIVDYVFSQESNVHNMQVGISYYLEILESATGESFILRKFNNVPDPQLLAVAAIEESIKYENDVLGGTDPKKFEELKLVVMADLKKSHPSSKFFNFKGIFGNFLAFIFHPQDSYTFHYVGVLYDIKNKRYNFLTTLGSLTQFLNKNRIEISGKKKLLTADNVRFLTLLFDMTGANSYCRFVAIDESSINSSPYNTPPVKLELPKRIEKHIKVICAPKIVDGAFVMFTLDRPYPSNLSKWTISEKGNLFSLRRDILIDDLYLPDFVRGDPISPEDNRDYIR